MCLGLVFPFAVVWREPGTVFFVELNASRVTGSRFPAGHAIKDILHKARDIFLYNTCRMNKKTYIVKNSSLTGFTKVYTISTNAKFRVF